MLSAAGYTAETEKKSTLEKDVAEMFREAKKNIYSKNWQKAIRLFTTIAEEHSRSKWGDDALYWLGYSLNNKSKSRKKTDDTVSLKIRAIEELSRLHKRYPDSKWSDDANLLIVEIAGELAKRGLKKYKKVILDSAKEKDNFEIKLAALDSLLNMENEKAFPILEKIVRKDKNAEMRKKALFILSQHNHSRVIPLLVEAALKDKNEENRKSAVFWLGQMDRPDSNRELLKLYNTVGMDLKSHILSAISQYGEDKAAKQLILLYKQEKDLDLSKQIIFCLGNNDSKEARKFILKLLE